MVPALLSLLLPARAEVPDETDWSDIVIVWPDKLARWRHTRWLVAAEVVLPIGMVFGKEYNHEFRTHAFQVKAVIACDEDDKLSARRIEVGCDIEDIGIQATSLDRWRTARGRARVQDILDNLDRRLTGAVVQLQVNDKGGVDDLDLEGLDPRNQRERLQQETMRLVTARLMYPFHMRIPRAGMKRGQWVEFNSVLMSMPTAFGILGSSTLVHQVSVYQDWLLVQDIGEGLVSVPRGGVVSTADAVPGGEEVNPESTVAFSLRMDGVSIYDIDTGIMTERVWSITGTPTAAELTSQEFWYSGRIQMLGTSDTPDVGPTTQIGYPDIEIEGLPSWLPVDPELAEQVRAIRKSRYVLTPKAREPEAGASSPEPRKTRR